MAKIKEYQKEDLTVIWESSKCIHSGICVRNLGEVFNPSKRPWINLDVATKKQIIDQVEQCPSGALSYRMEGQKVPHEALGELQQIELIPNGPLVLYGSCHIKLVSGEEEEKSGTVYFCRCGHSATKPYCDGSHRRKGFKDE